MTAPSRNGAAAEGTAAQGLAGALESTAADRSSQHRCSDTYYDKVLVDAECSHDGSAVHVRKVLGVAAVDTAGLGDRLGDGLGATEGAPGGLPPTVPAATGAARLSSLLCPEASAALVAKQRALLAAGFKLLRPLPVSTPAEAAGDAVAVGGEAASRPALVYSTCSLTVSQNEGVVRWLLDSHPTARLDPTPFAAADRAAGLAWSPGRLPHALRFGAAGATSGLFVARIVKVPA